MFAFAVRNDLLAKNPAEHMMAKPGSELSEDRDPFDGDDIKAIFSTPLFQGASGREDEDIGEQTVFGPSSGGRGEAFVAALGGAGNLRAVAACTTRLRLQIVSREQVDDAALKRLGARGLIAPSPDALQVVIGPMADAVAQEMRDHVAERQDALSSGQPKPGAATLTSKMETALGGRGNIKTVADKAGRICVLIVEPRALDIGRLEDSCPKGFVRTSEHRLQIIV
jgi:PTS system N-acetylglucosamine-specific IIC component